jgi:hypothetical protein
MNLELVLEKSLEMLLVESVSYLGELLKMIFRLNFINFILFPFLCSVPRHDYLCIY